METDKHQKKIPPLVDHIDPKYPTSYDLIQNLIIFRSLFLRNLILYVSKRASRAVTSLLSSFTYLQLSCIRICLFQFSI